MPLKSMFIIPMGCFFSASLLFSSWSPALLEPRGFFALRSGRGLIVHGGWGQWIPARNLDDEKPRKQKKEITFRSEENQYQCCRVFLLVYHDTCLISFLILSQWICGSLDNSGRKEFATVLYYTGGTITTGSMEGIWIEREKCLFTIYVGLWWNRKFEWLESGF